MPPSLVQSAPRVRMSRTATRVYVPLGVLMTVIAAVGFWPTYFGPLAAGTLRRVPIIHVHAVVYSGWLALWIAQAAFAATRRTALHITVGRAGMWYGVLVIAVGLATAFSQFATRVGDGRMEEASRRLFGPLVDMVFFSAFLGAAWWYRRKPEIHKRLMVVATTMLLVAAVSRLPAFAGRRLTTSDYPLFLALWLSPIYLGMLYDWLRHRKVHGAYIVGFVTLVVVRFRTSLADTATWIAITNWLAAWVV